MATTKNDLSPAALFDEGFPIDDAVALATRNAILRSKLLGQSIAVQENAQVVIVPADEIQIDDDQSAG